MAGGGAEEAARAPSGRGEGDPGLGAVGVGAADGELTPGSGAGVAVTDGLGLAARRVSLEGWSPPHPADNVKMTTSSESRRRTLIYS